MKKDMSKSVVKRKKQLTMTHRSATMTWVMCLWYYSMALKLKLFDLMYNFPNKKKDPLNGFH